MELMNKPDPTDSKYTRLGKKTDKVCFLSKVYAEDCKKFIDLLLQKAKVLPHYRKNDKHAFKIWKDGLAMKVWYNDGKPKVQIVEDYEEVFLGTEECTLKEFKKCYGVAIIYMDQHQHQVI